MMRCFKWWDAIVVESVLVLWARLPMFAVVYIIVRQLIIVWLSYRSLWYFVSKQRVATRLDGKPNNRLHEVHVSAVHVHPRVQLRKARFGTLHIKER